VAVVQPKKTKFDNADLTYQFSFLAESLVVEDIRKGSLNRYKRFLECFSVSDAMKLNENSHYTCDEIAQKKYEYHYGDGNHV
jgi:hypothetical protein